MHRGGQADLGPLPKYFRKIVVQLRPEVWQEVKASAELTPSNFKSRLSFRIR
jgi:hypothetical protein